MRYAYLSMWIPAVLISACASNAVQENLGKSVAQMVKAQVSDPATLIGNQDHPVEGLDPEAAKVAIESMRKDTPERTAVRRDVLINVGTQQNSGGNQ
jgi:type IV pilus biogenesis protein CpaD/CtpE